MSGKRITAAIASGIAVGASLIAAGEAVGVVPQGDQRLIGRWKYQNSHSVAELVGVFFKDPKNGWLVGGEGSNLRPDRTTVVRHTTNGGDTWVEDLGAKNAETLAAGHELKRVFVRGSDVWILGEQTDTQTGPSPCNDPTPSNTPNDQAIIIHSGNGGRTWTRQASGTCEDLESIYMFDSQHGLIGVNPGPPAFTEGTYLQTSNGGATWTPRTLTAAGAPSCNIADSLFFPPSNKPFNQREGWAADTCIVHTTDGGQTWTQQTVDGAMGTIGWEHVLGANGTMVAVNEASNNSSATNVARYNPAGPGSWTTQDVSGPPDPNNPGVAGDLYTVVFVDHKWFAIGESPGEEAPTIFVSTDNAMSWSELRPPGGMGEPQSGSAFTLDSKHAWVVGQQGTVFAYRVEPPPPPAPSCTLAPAGGKSSFGVKPRSRRVIRAKSGRGTFKVSVKCDQDAVGALSAKVTEKTGGKKKTFRIGAKQLILKRNVAKTVKLKLSRAARQGLASGAETTVTVRFTGSNSSGKGNASLFASIVPKP